MVQASLSVEQQIKQVSRITLFSLLNLTFLPVVAFVWLLLAQREADKPALVAYYLQYCIMLNLYAALALGGASGLMIFFGGFNSPWTWVYVITYFTFVHTVFILLAVWAMTRAWSGKKLTDKQ